MIIQNVRTESSYFGMMTISDHYALKYQGLIVIMAQGIVVMMAFREVEIYLAVKGAAHSPADSH